MQWKKALFAYYGYEQPACFQSGWRGSEYKGLRVTEGRKEL